MDRLEYYERIMGLLHDHDFLDAVCWFPRREGENQEGDEIPDGGYFAAIVCNDVFYWGTADLEYIKEDELDLFDQCLTADPIRGVLLFCARKRGMRPQGAFYKMLDDKEKELFRRGLPERETDIANPFNENNEYEYR